MENVGWVDGDMIHRRVAERVVSRPRRGDRLVSLDLAPSLTVAVAGPLAVMALVMELDRAVTLVLLAVLWMALALGVGGSWLLGRLSGTAPEFAESGDGGRWAPGRLRTPALPLLTGYHAQTRHPRAGRLLGVDRKTDR